MKPAAQHINDAEVFILENDNLEVSVVPAIGGKILSIYNKQLKHEFLWTNENLELKRHGPGTEYDPNFLGGIDELIPNDIPEIIDGIAYPDHGELWTTSLHHETGDNKIKVYGTLKLSGLYYSKTISLVENSPAVHLQYHIKNNSGKPINFMWKLHAALNIMAEDKIVTPAKKAKVADPEYSRFKKQLKEFAWPHIENTDASVIPAKNGSMDFMYLYDVPTGEMQLENKAGHFFSYKYDPSIFPYQWLFASYGGFFDHYVAILEPCTNMPISVNEAQSLKQSAFLERGASLETSVTIFAGEKKNYIDK
ncbi:MAG: DUF5107 domain-containing protein [Chitinophagaceae bacterium]|nr:DUF5107 domain-containing protein [Chitinophagaceae bacterium]